MVSVTPSVDVRYPRTCNGCESPWLTWSNGTWFRCLLCGARTSVGDDNRGGSGGEQSDEKDLQISDEIHLGLGAGPRRDVNGVPAGCVR